MVPINAQVVALVVRDYLSGGEVLRQTVAAGEHTATIGLHSLAPGPYHYALEVDGVPVAHHNLLVQ